MTYHKIILDEDINIISTVFVVAKSAIIEIIKLPLFSNTVSITNDKGTFDEYSSCHVTKLKEDITTKTYTIVVIIIDNNIALE
ncbi:MAG: hypothetical protein ACM3XP_05210, partial [Nitrososphaerales archaeon]